MNQGQADIAAERRPETTRRVILGIDPGSLRTGYAFLETSLARPRSPRDFRVVDAGVLRISAAHAHGERIALLHEAVYGLMREHAPSVCVIEKAFCDKNVSSALKLGELRGAYICAASRAAVRVEEITPAEVKKTIAGSGRADKEQVSRAVRALTGFERGTLPHDVTDALAIGLCFGLSLTRRFVGEIHGRDATS